MGHTFAVNAPYLAPASPGRGRVGQYIDTCRCITCNEYNYTYEEILQIEFTHTSTYMYVQKHMYNVYIMYL